MPGKCIWKEPHETLVFVTVVIWPCRSECRSALVLARLCRRHLHHQRLSFPLRRSAARIAPLLRGSWDTVEGCSGQVRNAVLMLHGTGGDHRFPFLQPGFVNSL